MSQYRIAIAGIGAIADKHARAIGDLPNAELVAGCCRTEPKGRAFADEHDCDWYDSVEAMLDGAEPDVMTICTPSGAHLGPTLAAAERGIHVLCEKPLEITTGRIDQMRTAASEANIQLGGIFPQRYNPVCRAVYDAAKAGRFGNLAIVSSVVPWWRDDEYYGPDRWQGTLELDGGGAMMNQSIHGVDMVQWLASAAMGPDHDPVDNPVTEVFAYTAQRGHSPDLIEVEDTAVAVLRFANGALGQLLGATSMYPGSLKRLQIGGRNGTAEILEDELTAFDFRESRDEDEEIRQQFGAETETGGGAADPMAIDYSHHTRNIEAFLKALDGESLEVDAAEARKAVAI
ncbi:MAG: Gfo/Idh/MocA family oxidoreductase, partial [Phycisphaeraceae bacterium]|nr:Gfo/Idh/MocA family oxidoreductase [Phycisphaeraceae bacterium]